MDDALTAFEHFMDGNTLLVWGVFLVVLYPALTLVHELGHAAVALARTNAPVLVQVGREGGLVRLRLGRLAISLDPLPRGPRAGLTRVGGSLTARERVAFALGGPAAEAIAGLALVAVGNIHASVLLTAGGGLAIGVAVVSLLPLAYGGVRTDGWHVRSALRGVGVDHERVARADALFRNRDAYVTPVRERLFAVAPIACGHAPEDRSDAAAALWQTAYAGWCWRESEDGSKDLRSEVRAALERGSAEGFEEPALIALAARLVAESDVDFGPAFAAATPPGDAASFAFRYGGAVREVERVCA
jgi:hypothetical protein